MIAVISDVHGNLPALEAVLADIASTGATRIWCLGDTVGYGPYVNECLSLVAERCEIVLAGNHDLAVRGDIREGHFGGSAAHGIHYAIRVLSPELREYMTTLAPSRLLDGVEMYHASARDPVWEYVNDVVSASGHLATQRAPLSLVGHSHIQLVFERIDNAQTALQAVGGRVAAGTVVPLGDGRSRVINPGSVGQPRDDDARAGWALLDSDRIEFRRVPYDTRPMYEAVRAAGLPVETAERLDAGW